MIAPNFGDEMWGFFNAIVLTAAIINKKMIIKKWVNTNIEDNFS